MMNYIETVGNIKVFIEHLKNETIKVSFLNGSDIVAQETYANTTSGKAISDLFAKTLDIYTEEYIWLYCLSKELIKLSDNTYKIGSNDWFCRIDDTKYFKHFVKSENEFVRDKDGKRIIDR